MNLYNTVLRWDMDTEEGKTAVEKLKSRSKKAGSISDYLMAAVLAYQEEPVFIDEIRQVIREELSMADIKKESEADLEGVGRRQAVEKKVETEHVTEEIPEFLSFADWESNDIFP